MTQKELEPDIRVAFLPVPGFTLLPFREIRDINFARNMAKHINPEKIPAWFVKPREEAQYMLYRAISNYRSLGEPLSEHMDLFLQMMENE